MIGSSDEQNQVAVVLTYLDDNDRWEDDRGDIFRIIEEASAEEAGIASEEEAEALFDKIVSNGERVGANVQWNTVPAGFIDFVFPIGKLLVPAVMGAFGAWLHAKSGRKVRLEFYASGAIRKVEAQTVEQVQQLMTSISPQVGEKKPKKMNQLAPLSTALPVPALVAAAGERAGIRFLEFFAVAIRNVHTRRSYVRAAIEFLTWCDDASVRSIVDVQPLHVAGFIEALTRSHAAPTAKARLAALRHLFDWLVVGQVVPVNPAASVRGPSHSAKRGKTPVLIPDEARELLDSIDISTPIGLRDRALIAVMAFAFARIGAVTGMKVEDAFTQQRRLWLRLHEKGGKVHEMPCHHTLEDYLHTYIDGCGLAADPKAPLFQTIRRGTSDLSGTALLQANAYEMIRRRASAIGITAKIGNHTFRATGITAYLLNGGTLEKAAAMANHSSTRTTQLYDRRSDRVTLDEIERVRI